MRGLRLSRDSSSSASGASSSPIRLNPSSHAQRGSQGSNMGGPNSPHSPIQNLSGFHPLPTDTFCTATSDGESLTVVNLGGLMNAAGVKERILAKLHIGDDDFFNCVFHLTKIGASGEGRKVSDEELWEVCAKSGVDGSTVTVYVKQFTGNQFGNDIEFIGSSAAQAMRYPSSPAFNSASASSPNPSSHNPQRQRRSNSPPDSTRRSPPSRDPRADMGSNRRASSPGRERATSPNPRYARRASESEQIYPGGSAATERMRGSQPAYQDEYGRIHSSSNQDRPPTASGSATRRNIQQPPPMMMEQSLSAESRDPRSRTSTSPNLVQNNGQFSRPVPAPPIHPQYAMPPASQYHNLYIHSQYQARPNPPTLPPRSLNPSYTKSTGDLRNQYVDPRAPPPMPNSIPSQYRLPPSTIPSYGSGPPPRHPPPLNHQDSQATVPRQAQFSQQRTPTSQSYPSFDPRVMRAPAPTRAPPILTSGSNQRINTSSPHPQYWAPSQITPALSTISSLSRNRHAPHLPHTNSSTLAPVIRATPELTGHIDLRPGETLQEVVSRRRMGEERETRKRTEAIPKTLVAGLHSASASTGTSRERDEDYYDRKEMAPRRSSETGYSNSASSSSTGGYGIESDRYSNRDSYETSKTDEGSLKTPLTPSSSVQTDCFSPTNDDVIEEDTFNETFSDEDSDDEAGTWQVGRKPLVITHPILEPVDDEEDDVEAATWMVSPATPIASSTSATLIAKEPRPNLRLTTDLPVAGPSSIEPKIPTPKSSSSSVLARARPRISPSPRSEEISIDRPPVLIRSTSFAHREENDWAFRPPVEIVLDNLDEFFPEHDLDKPILKEEPRNIREEVDVVGELPSREGSGVKLGLKPKKSIRKVALERKRNLQMATLEGEKEAKKKEFSLLRRKSTKLWGNKVEEVTPEQAKNMGNTIGESPATDDPDNFSFKWVKGELIGRGTYGQVYLALNVTTGDMLAVKQVELPKTRSDKDDLRQQAMVFSLKSEIELLKDLDHAKIVQYLGFEETISHLSIFLEYVPGGSVGRMVRKHGKFEESVTKSFTRQILEGLEYLHDLGILHRDLKADNILCDHVGNCKISDFGTSKKSNDIYSDDANMSMQGSIFWMAPEVVQNYKKGYSAKADIWSLGCICLEMWAGRRPWSDEEAIQAMFKLGAERLAPPIPTDVILTDASSHFLSECFRIEPERRPTASQLRRHIFLELPPDWDFLDSELNNAMSNSRSNESRRA